MSTTQYAVLFSDWQWRVIQTEWDDDYWRVYLSDAGSERQAQEITAALNAKENA